MKRFGWILVLLLAASPAWAAKKITVQQLKDLLISLQQEKKTDADVAVQLRQVELTEELTLATMNSLVNYVPGPYSTEQIYVLEARSALLAPPAVDLPATPAPDAATQKAILDKAVDYTTKTYAQLPHLTATKTTIRFQDSMEVVKASSGMHSSASYGDDPALAMANQYIRYINSTETPVESANGVEKVSTAKDKTPWGQNGQIVLLGQGPVLSTVLQEAQAAGTINWLRWELVNGREAAVYSFTVDKKKSHYAINYCCFPNWEQTGRMSFSGASGSSGPGASAPSNMGDYSAKGNMQTNATFNPYKATVPYHGEIFVDPNTGIVVRLITIADFKATDVVHQEDQRIDYGPVTVGGKALELPIKTIVNTEIVPNGDTGGGKYITRHTLFTAEYKDYQPAAH
ncbi:MAG: hypothetical protein ABSC88_06900 [Terracidiphilus sp.]